MISSPEVTATNEVCLVLEIPISRQYLPVVLLEGKARKSWRLCETCQKGLDNFHLSPIHTRVFLHIKLSHILLMSMRASGWYIEEFGFMEDMLSGSIYSFIKERDVDEKQTIFSTFMSVHSCPLTNLTLSHPARDGGSKGNTEVIKYRIRV